MPSMEIDPELNRLAIAEAAELYPEFADQASHVTARPLSEGRAWRFNHQTCAGAELLFARLRNFDGWKICWQ